MPAHLGKGSFNDCCRFVRLCDDVDASSYNDVANLFSNLAGNFENVVQYNRDNRAFEVLSSVCAVFSFM